MFFWSTTALGILVLAIALGGYFLKRELDGVEETDANCRMVEGAPDFATNLKRFKGLNLSAFVTGYSGGVGRNVVEELNKLKIFKRVVLIGRRQLELIVGPEFEQKVIDFEKLDEYTDLFKDLHIGFHCLGTSQPDVGKEMYVRVDRDYALKIGEMAKNQGCKHLLILTTALANPNSFSFGLRMKGQVEERQKELDFDRLSIYRPAALLGSKKEALSEVAFKFFFKPLIFMFPTKVAVPRVTVAKAMIVDVISPNTKDCKAKIVHNSDMHTLAKEFPA